MLLDQCFRDFLLYGFLVQVANELFIQRSTMIYRLKRIREITDSDLEDSDDLLHLYLTFSVIERGG